jgi:hypothetical protein
MMFYRYFNGVEFMRARGKTGKSPGFPLNLRPRFQNPGSPGPLDFKIVSLFYIESLCTVNAQSVDVKTHGPLLNEERRSVPFGRMVLFLKPQKGVYWKKCGTN